MAFKTLINGQAYNFVNVQLSIDGVSSIPGFTGVHIKSISYNASQSKTANYENSMYATTYSYGKKEFSGSVTFTLDAAEFLRDAIFELGTNTRSLLDLPPTDFNIKFTNKGKFNSVKIRNVALKTENFSGSEGDATMGITCDFIASDIEYDKKTELLTAVLYETGAVIINQTDNQTAI